VAPDRALFAHLSGTGKRTSSIGCGLANTAAFPVWACGLNWNNLSAFVEGELYVHRPVCSFGAGLAGGFLVFHVSSALIHILLLFAALSLIVHFFQRKTLS
jgi:hypothetical protein